MAERPLRVGVIGADPTGRGFGPRAHIPAVLAAPGLELFAVGTAHEETARQAAERFGAQRHHASAEALCADPDVDLVTVSVRVRGHLRAVEAAIANGKPVYCEWPLGLDAAEAASMATAAEAAGVPNAVGTQGRFAPAVMVAREVLDRGDIGRPLTFEVVHQLPPFDVDEDRVWLTRVEEASGALHVATGHVTDTVRFLLGEVAEITGVRTTAAPEGVFTDSGRPFTWQTPDVVGYVARLADGVTGVAHVTNLARPIVGFHLRVFGELGTLVLEAPGYVSFAPARVRVERPDGSSEEPSIPDGYRRGIGLPDDHPGSNVGRALVAFAEAIRAGQPFRPDFRDALGLHQVVEAIARSSDEGGWERLAADR